jgi:hypothetical protein
MRRYDLSNDTIAIVHDDGAITLEVLVGNDIVAVALTPAEVVCLMDILRAKLAEGGE